ncbi:MAG: 50S ribosomal protein L29 [Alphaproteobacteria bacterium]|nr:50S ribosomal protein L29 [Alphaproteobacteria bacterium]
MSLEDLRAKTDDQLKEMLIDLKKELLNLRFQKASSELRNTSQFDKAKKQVAKIKTILRERKDKK